MRGLRHGFCAAAHLREATGKEDDRRFKARMGHEALILQES